MPGNRIRARVPRGELREPARALGNDLQPYLSDAARTPGGHAPAVYFPETEGEVAWLLRECEAVLPIGAQSSLTGGATPFGATLLSTSRLTALGPVEDERVRVGAGVALVSLREALTSRGLFYPPATTFEGALIGGTAATNAAGAATFKYGTTRDWIESLTIVLACGDVLDVARGSCRAGEHGVFEIELTSGARLEVPAPSDRLPEVPKCSAGYHAAPDLDIVDLFVGSEGTLGVITDLELRVRPSPPRLVLWAFFGDDASALEAVAALRTAARATWAARDPRGIDVAAIESLDARCLALLREDGLDRECHLSLPESARMALFVEAELDPSQGADAAFDQIAEFADPRADTPITRLLRLLRDHGADEPLLALPGDRRRAAELARLREAVPLTVNHRIEALQRRDPGIRKAAADMIVPFDRLRDMLVAFRQALQPRGLESAVWGHVSDGNLHLNVLPDSAADVAAAQAAFLEIGDRVIALGGSPLAEHGVGRNPVKQELMRRLRGDAAVEALRRVKARLDPAGRLSPGVLFPPGPG